MKILNRIAMLNAKTLKILLPVISLSLFSSVAHPSEKYESNYDVGDYFDALVNAGLERALEMAEEQIREKLVSIINDPEQRDKVLKRLAEKGIEWADGQLNDDSKTEMEKAEGITDIIVSSFPPYDSGKQGSLNVRLRYSPDFLVTEVAWDRKIQVLDCHEGSVGMSCDFDSYSGSRDCNFSGEYERVPYSVEPEYRIYRVVNGAKKLVTKINGQLYKGDATFSTKPDDWVKQIEALISGADNKYGSPGRVSNFDFDSDVREPNTTLSYIIEADSSAVWNRHFGSDSFCESASSWSSQVYLDENSDGYADFVPKSEYPTSFANILPAINHIILN